LGWGRKGTLRKKGSGNPEDVNKKKPRLYAGNTGRREKVKEKKGTINGEKKKDGASDNNKRRGKRYGKKNHPCEGRAQEKRIKSTGKKVGRKEEKKRGDSEERSPGEKSHPSREKRNE